MRHPHYAAPAGLARDLFARAEVVHVAAASPEGRPLLRTVHGVVVGEHLCFHGADLGEKSALPGWPVVISAERIFAEIPSYFVDPERACPATTYYESAMVEGTLEAVHDPELKAQVLSALMARFQPEGGHRPITATDPLYENVVRALLILRIPLEGAVGKIKLGQNRRPAELHQILGLLWDRGRPGDPEAITRVLLANQERLESLPDFLAAPPGVRLLPFLTSEHAAASAQLLSGQYWTQGLGLEALAQAQLGSTAWVGAFEGDRLIGSARAMSDGARLAWLYDVVVESSFRGRGVGQALVRLLLDHPAVRGARKVLLGTKDAMPLYQRFGFAEVDSPLSTRNGRLMAWTRPLGSRGSA
ncbi:MAG: GNAT family N-acetyltransferase [Deltaproteobacteria bacterium]|nr:GNAT family N-acetyltransferase [Deltaproteobacteria bacterium]